MSVLVVGNYNMIDADPTQDYPELAPEAEADVSAGDDKPLAVNYKDWTVEALCGHRMRNRITLQPEYQREYVWRLKPELPSRLIESLLLNVPVPPIYFAKLSSDKLEVIDGQQRLNTLFRFIDNEFELQKLDRIKGLNGHKFNQLSDKQRNIILEARISSVEIETGMNDQMRYEVFERLNRGSMALNEQEIRNCVYRGLFCDLLAKLEKDPAWRRVKGGTEPEPRFAEREMILRFFAFAERINYYQGNLKRFLNEYMANYSPKDQDKIDEQAEMFRQTMRNIYTVFGDRSARLYSAGTESHPTAEGKWETKFSVSALDIQASALLGQPPAKVQAMAEQIREAYLLYILSSQEVRLAISRQPAGGAATRTRCFGFKAQVQDILNDTTLEPRFFLYSFRRQLFDSDPTCKICRNQIHNFEDSAVDHIHPFSKGGKTQPDNAQLAHRSCNARKCAADIDPSTTPKTPNPAINMATTRGAVTTRGKDTSTQEGLPTINATPDAEQIRKGKNGNGSVTGFESRRVAAIATLETPVQHATFQGRMSDVRGQMFKGQAAHDAANQEIQFIYGKCKGHYYMARKGGFNPFHGFDFYSDDWSVAVRSNP